MSEEEWGRERERANAEREGLVRAFSLALSLPTLATLSTTLSIILLSLVRERESE